MADCTRAVEVVLDYDSKIRRIESDVASSSANFIARQTQRLNPFVDSISEAFQGRLPGELGSIVENSSMLESALNAGVQNRSNELLSALDKGLYGSRSITSPLRTGGALDEMRYVGPSKHTDAANGVHRDKVWASTPRDYWENVPAQLYRDLDELRSIAFEAKSLAEELGYPSSSFIDNYARQQWEEVDAAVSYFSGLDSGVLIGPAKHRTFPNYAIGIEAGFTPTSKTVSELMADSIALWNRATADAWQRREVLRAFGSKTGKTGITSNKSKFRTALYRGWNADRDIVKAIDDYHKPLGAQGRALLNVSSRSKNLAFGTIDIAISGLQGLKAVVTGGIQLLSAEVLRGLGALRIAPAQKWRVLLDSPTGMDAVVDATGHGLVQSANVGGVTVGKGTPLQYGGKIGKALDRPLSLAIDAKAKVEFGMVLDWIRLELYRGNLLMMHMTGRDISDSSVRRIAANWANAMTGASRMAQTPNRRLLEASLTSSPSMLRSEVATLGTIAKAATVGSGLEKQMAMMTLASVGATVYGVASAINMAQGHGPVEWDPRSGTWATVIIGGKNIPIIPQRGLIRAIGKSVAELQELDQESFERLSSVWTQYVLSKAAPGTASPAASAAGFGFDPNKGFQTGDLETRWKILNGAPLPPVLSALITGETDPVSVGFNIAGFNPFPQSPLDRLEQAWNASHPDEPFNREVHFVRAEQEFPELVEEVRAASRRFGSEASLEAEVRRGVLTEQEQGLVPFSQGLLDGTDPDVGEKYREQRRAFLTFSAGTAAQAFDRFDIKPNSPEGKILQEYYDIDLADYLNLDTLETDWAAFEFAQNSKLDELAQTAPLAAEGIRSSVTDYQDPVNIQAGELYERARPLIDQLFGDDNLGTFTGISQAGEQRLREFMRDVQAQRNRFEIENGTKPSVEASIRALGRIRNLDQGFINFAVAARPSSATRDRLKNIEREIFLLRHYDELGVLFSSFYDSSRMRKAIYKMDRSQGTPSSRVPVLR